MWEFPFFVFFVATHKNLTRHCHSSTSFIRGNKAIVAQIVSTYIAAKVEQCSRWLLLLLVTSQTRALGHFPHGKYSSLPPHVRLFDCRLICVSSKSYYVQTNYTHVQRGMRGKLKEKCVNFPCTANVYWPSIGLLLLKFENYWYDIGTGNALELPI